MCGDGNQWQQNNTGKVMMQGNCIMMLEALEQVEIMAVQLRNSWPLFKKLVLFSNKNWVTYIFMEGESERRR
jgi:hypothetical protein